MQSAMEVFLFCQSCLLLKVYTDAGYISSYHGEKTRNCELKKKSAKKKNKNDREKQKTYTRTTVRESEMNWSPFAMSKG